MTLLSIPANPVPENYVSGFITASDGVRLRYARWAPPEGRKGTVCLFTGRAEYIEKYFETVRDLRKRGFAVAMIDWRGQGHSDRALSDARRGYVRSFAEYDRDLEALFTQIVLPDCPPPYFGMAHSMGGTVLIRAAAQNKRYFERTILSSPMIGLAGLRFLGAARTLIRFMALTGFGSRYAVAGNSTIVGAQAFEGNPLTSDPVRYARNATVLETDPTLGIASPTIAWVRAAFAAMAEFRDPAYPARIRHPILIVAAGQDRVVSTAATEDFALRLRAGSRVVIPAARHEILMEHDRIREQFWAAFDAFIPGTPVF